MLERFTKNQMHDQKSVKCMNCVSVKSQALFPNYYYYYLHFFFRAKTITYDFFHRKLEVNIILCVCRTKAEDWRHKGDWGKLSHGEMP